jgi:hypothetical protein
MISELLSGSIPNLSIATNLSNVAIAYATYSNHSEAWQ